MNFILSFCFKTSELKQTIKLLFVRNLFILLVNLFIIMISILISLIIQTVGARFGFI